MSSHMLRGRQLSRDTEHRAALRRSLVQSLIEHGKIRTTEPKAKEVKAFAEKVITEARKGTLNARRRVIAMIQDRKLVDANQEFITEGSRSVIEKLFKDVAPKFASRKGGYTRIIKLPDYRIGDGGSLVILQLLDQETPEEGGATTASRGARKSAGLRRKRNERKHAFASKALKKPEAAASAS